MRRDGRDTKNVQSVLASLNPTGGLQTRLEALTTAASVKIRDPFWPLFSLFFSGRRKNTFRSEYLTSFQ